MSRNSKRNRESSGASNVVTTAVESEITPEVSETKPPKIRLPFGYLRTHLWATAILAFLALGVLGAGLKYLDEDAKAEMAKNKKDRSFLSSVNPFMPPPSPTPTVQLSKQYIYAGSKLLAVADAGAEAVPPADLAIWRPSNGLWCVLGGTGSAQTIYGWGMNGDQPAPGDYDGDGKTDFAVYRGSSTTFWIMKSSDNTYYGVTQGANGDKPVPGDYDGDGKTDTALFRSSNSTWYIVQSSDSGGVSTTWGTTSDKTAPADYDGDGKADITVWRPSDKTFYTLPSTGGSYQAYTVGSATTDTPVPGDYTGDGKADFAVLNGNYWIIRDSSTGSTSSTQWQNAGDIPVQNDYDGDGKVDIASWRDSNGYWYIRQSSFVGQSNELRSVAWGMSGDIPVPAHYRR
jgi:hypothetical protein